MQHDLSPRGSSLGRHPTDHAAGYITSRSGHTLDAALVMSADTVSGYIQALLDGAKLSHTRDAGSRLQESGAGPLPDAAPGSANVSGRHCRLPA